MVVAVSSITFVFLLKLANTDDGPNGDIDIEFVEVSGNPVYPLIFIVFGFFSFCLSIFIIFFMPPSDDTPFAWALAVLSILLMSLFVPTWLFSKVRIDRERVVGPSRSIGPLIIGKTISASTSSIVRIVHRDRALSFLELRDGRRILFDRAYRHSGKLEQFVESGLSSRWA